MSRACKKIRLRILKKKFESLTKLINTKLIDISDKLEKFNNLQNTELRTEGALRVEEIQLKYGETKIIVNAKFFLDINKSIEDIKMNLKHLEQDIKSKFLEKKKKSFRMLPS